MARPRVRVYMLAEAEILRHVVGPCNVSIEGVERIRDAPAMVEILQTKLEQGSGWIVMNMDELRRASSLDDCLRKLRREILPALEADPADRNALRRLSLAAREIRRIGTKCTGYMRVLVIGLANRLRRVATKVLSNKRPAAWLAVRLRGIHVYAKNLHKKRYIPFPSSRRARAPMARRVYLLAEAENLRRVVGPYYVSIEGVERIRDAPAMAEILQAKLQEGSGWIVKNMDKLRHASSLDDCLRKLRRDILPALEADPADRNALRRLSLAAREIRRIGTKCTGYMRVLVIGLANRLRRVATKVLSNKRPAAWLADRLGGIQLFAIKVHKKRYIPFE